MYDQSQLLKLRTYNIYSNHLLKECSKIWDELNVSEYLYNSFMEKVDHFFDSSSISIVICITWKFFFMLTDKKCKRINYSNIKFDKSVILNHISTYLSKIWDEIKSREDRFGKEAFHISYDTSFSKIDHILYKVHDAQFTFNGKRKLIDDYLMRWNQVLIIEQRKKDFNSENSNLRESFFHLKKIEYISIHGKNKAKLNEKDKLENGDVSSQQYRLSQLRFENGSNCCWLNTILFVFYILSEETRKLLYCKKFFPDKEESAHIKELLNRKWDDYMYMKFFDMLKKNTTIEWNFGEQGDPLDVLQFFVSNHNNRTTNTGRSLEVFTESFNMTTLIKRLSSDTKIIAIIKSTEEPHDDHDAYTTFVGHFVAFFRMSQINNEESDSDCYSDSDELSKDWILFDSQYYNKVNEGEMYTERDIYSYGTTNSLFFLIQYC